MATDRDEEATQMVEDCMSVISIPMNRGGPGFNDWEREFLEGIEDRLSDGRALTEREFNKLYELWERV